MPSGMFVGVDAHIDPRAVTNSPKISEKTVRFAGAMWASTPTKRRENFRNLVGADDSVRPAEHISKTQKSPANSYFCRDDVGIAPYANLRNF